MAKILFGALLADARGKVGGTVFSRNKGGAYMKNKVTPLNPRTIAQVAIRNLLAALSAAWRNLTAAQIAAWNAAVLNFPRTDIFGASKTPTGKNLYVGLNANLNSVGAASISAVPAPGAVASIESASLTAAAGAGTFTVVFGPSPVPADSAFIVEATPSYSAGRSFVNSLFRQISFLDAAATTPAVLAAAYAAKFGAMSAGSKVSVRITGVNKLTGQKGVGFITTAIIAA